MILEPLSVLDALLNPGEASKTRHHAPSQTTRRPRDFEQKPV